MSLPGEFSLIVVDTVDDVARRGVAAAAAALPVGAVM